MTREDWHEHHKVILAQAEEFNKWQQEAQFNLLSNLKNFLFIIHDLTYITVFAKMWVQTASASVPQGIRKYKKRLSACKVDDRFLYLFIILFIYHSYFINKPRCFFRITFCILCSDCLERNCRVSLWLVKIEWKICKMSSEGFYSALFWFLYVG